MNIFLKIGICLLLIWVILEVIKILLGKNSHYNLETDIKKKPD